MDSNLASRLREFSIEDLNRTINHSQDLILEKGEKKYSNIRDEMNSENFEKAKNFLKGNGSDSSINITKYNKLLNRVGVSSKDFKKECENNSILLDTSAFTIAKEASRQGSKIEKEQIQNLKDNVKDYGVEMEKCNVSELRPLKSGGFITNKKIKENKINKEADCLKTIDAKITSPFTAFCFIKMLNGGGGHQTNVIKETHEFIKWARGEPDNQTVYIVVIDGDFDLKTLELENLPENIWVGNSEIIEKRIRAHVTK